MADLLQKELDAFEAQKDQLLASALGKYVLIYGDQVLGTYDTENDAVVEGYRKCGNVPFLVKLVVPFEQPLRFISGHLGI